MKILDILNAPWMMSQEYHSDLKQVYLSHFRGEKIDFKGMEKAFMDGSEARKEKLNTLNIIDGTAIIDIEGPLTPGLSLFSFLFGGTSMSDIRTQLEIADGNPDVENKLFVVNSPGGTVQGAFELAAFVKESNAIKPIVSFATGMIASAAYAIVAPTSGIYISSMTNLVGSIGVISSKADYTEMDAKAGVKYDEYVSGIYKNLYSSDRKTDEFVSGAIQETVDYLATIFINFVNENRPQLSIEFLTDLQARVLIGQQAIDSGLVDGVSTMSAILKQPQKTRFQMAIESITDLKEQKPDLYQQAVKEGEAKADLKVLEERKRITEIRGAAFPGQEKLIDECIEKGISPGEAAMAFIKAEKESGMSYMKEVKEEKITPVAISENSTPEEEEIEEKKDFKALVKEHAEQNKCSHAQAVKAVAKSNPEAHQDYLNGINAK